MAVYPGAATSGTGDDLGGNFEGGGSAAGTAGILRVYPGPFGRRRRGPDPASVSALLTDVAGLAQEVVVIGLVIPDEQNRDDNAEIIRIKGPHHHHHHPELYISSSLCLVSYQQRSTEIVHES